MEEIVVHRVLLGEETFREVGGVETAQYETRIVAPGDVLVLWAAVYLRLLLKVAMDDIPSLG
jgi:hypothetical protein